MTKNAYRNLAIGLAVVSLVLAAALVWQMNKEPVPNTNEPATSEQEPADSDQPENTDAGCRTFTNGNQACTSWYIGLSEEDALAKATREELAHRVVVREGESLPVTMDLREDRINFEIENGKVTKAEFY